MKFLTHLLAAAGLTTCLTGGFAHIAHATMSTAQATTSTAHATTSVAQAPARTTATQARVTDEVQIFVTPSTVHDAIDRALRYVRGTQNLETGHYGAGVADTARVLVAMAESPRKYRLEDGPFISHAADFLLGMRQADGLIHDAELVETADKLGQALLAVRALEAIEMPGYFGAHATPRDEMVAAAKAAAGDLFPGLQAASRASGGPLPAGIVALLLVEQAESGAFGERLTTDGHARLLQRLTATWRSLGKAEAAKAPVNVEALPAFSAQSSAEALTAMRRGANYLVNDAMIAPGRWGTMGQADPGITAMVLGGLAQLPEPRGETIDAAIDASVEWLLSLQKEDGSIHAGQLQNYVTSASVTGLAALGRDELAGPIARARGFLTELQADEGEGYSPDHRYYGGVGYGGDERPDLSNLQMAIEALAAAGADGEDPAMQKALAFLERTQNRKESNDVKIESPEGDIVSGDDGGGTYMPGNSKAGFVVLEDGTRVPRSYGSMTFALLKSYLLAGLEKDDPRVQAAYSWIQAHYTLEYNPGFESSSDPGAAYQGLFYYFLGMSRALELFESDTLTSADGVVHEWRGELTGRLATMQLPDGSWINSNSPRWYEGNPTLATAYALQCFGAILD